MPTFEYDRRYVELGLELLETYLLAESAYWPVELQPSSGEPPYPLLTLEGLMLSLRRMLAIQGDLIEKTQTAKLSLAMDAIHNRWRVAWEKKATRAYQTRLNLWRNYLEEFRELPDAHADRYAYEVRLRVFLTLLEKDCAQIDAVHERLAGLDTYLRSVLIPGRFVWADGLQPGFPTDDYWYLYGVLPRSPVDTASGLRN
jgi:hypothetical protein